MSRIGKKPITIPQGVDVKLSDGRIDVKGPNGTLSMEYLPMIEFQQDGDAITVLNPGDLKENRKFHGLYRSLLSNLVLGVSEGFKRRLEIRGQGYRAGISGKKLELHVGHSHPVRLDIPEGMKVEVEEKKGEKLTLIDLWGIDKQALGQFAANIRAKRKPEPYKGKGIRYQGEFVRQKQGKKTV